MNRVPAVELTDRMQRFRLRMDADWPDWELAAFFGRPNQYYFTGTMQDGVLLIPRDAQAVFCVRRSYERACEESLFEDIRPMKGFRDAITWIPPQRQILHVETEIVPMALLNRFTKHFPCRTIASLDRQIAGLRAVKSPYELAIMKRTGAIHCGILEQGVPTLLREGISEAEFGCELFSLMVREGHQGMVRFGMFGADIVIGQLGFGTHSIYPTSFVFTELHGTRQSAG